MSQSNQKAGVVESASRHAHAVLSMLLPILICLGVGWSVALFHTFVDEKMDSDANMCAENFARNENETSAGATVRAEADASAGATVRAEADVESTVCVHDESRAKAGGEASEEEEIYGDLLGEGTFGNVHASNETIDGVAIVYKRMKILFDEDDWTTASEVAALEAIPKHPNVVTYFGYFLDSRDKPVVRLRRMEVTLQHAAHAVRQRGERVLHGLADMYNQVASGVLHLHTHGFMHRDLKPTNILVDNPLDDYARQVCICDFGLAILHMRGRCNTLLVQSLWWRAPEVLMEVPSYDPSIDLWSLGIILIQLCFKEATVFTGKNVQEQLSIVINICEQNPTELATPPNPNSYTGVAGAHQVDLWGTLWLFDSACYHVATQLLRYSNRQLLRWQPSVVKEELCVRHMPKGGVEEVAPPLQADTPQRFLSKCHGEFERMVPPGKARTHAALLLERSLRNQWIADSAPALLAPACAHLAMRIFWGDAAAFGMLQKLGLPIPQVCSTTQLVLKAIGFDMLPPLPITRNDPHPRTKRARHFLRNSMSVVLR